MNRPHEARAHTHTFSSSDRLRLQRMSREKLNFCSVLRMTLDYIIDQLLQWDDQRDFSVHHEDCPNFTRGVGKNSLPEQDKTGWQGRQQAKLFSDFTPSIM